MYYTQNSYVCFEYNSILGKRWTTTTRLLQKSWCANARRTCTLPRPTSLRQHMLPSSFKREDDGREGAISGRLARKATGVSPSSFARIGVFAGKWYLQISPETIVQKHDAGKVSAKAAWTLGGLEVWFPGRVLPCTIYYEDTARGGLGVRAHGSLEAWRVVRGGGRPVPYTIRTGRETEGGGRGQRRSRRATDGAQAVRAHPCVFAVPISPDTIGALLHVLYIL